MTEKLAEFPAKTADTLEVKYVEQVAAPVEVKHLLFKAWIQTLNKVAKTEVARQANFFAARQVGKIRADKELYYAFRSELEAYTDDEQVEYLVSYYLKSGAPTRIAAQKLPNVPMPERGAQSEEEYVEAVALAMKTNEARTEERRKMWDDLTGKVREDALKMTRETRTERCMSLFIQDQYAQFYSERHAHELIMRCTRQLENHRELYFNNIDDVAALEDDVRDAIIERYYELDSLTYDDVPTLPNGVSG